MSTGWFRRIVPAALGTAMLAILVAAALSPNTGAVSAQSNCQYGSCPASSPAFPWWIVAVVVAVVVVALLALLFVMRARRPPTSGGTLTPWSAGSPPPGASPPSSPPAAAPAYLETAEDVGHAPPAVSVPAAGAAAGGAAAGTAAAEGEPDIDSLMAELDKISGEILKRAPKKGGGSSSTPPPEDDEA